MGMKQMIFFNLGKSAMMTVFISAMMAVPVYGDDTNSIRIFSESRMAYATLNGDGVIGIQFADRSRTQKVYHCSPVAAVFSNDGALLCTAGQRECGGTSFKVWRLSDGKLISRLTSEANGVPLMAFSKGKDWLACVGGQSTVAVWDIVSGKMTWSTQLNRKVVALSFADEDCSLLVTCRNESPKRFGASDGGMLHD
jgi:WD40 repeat protein